MSPSISPACPPTPLYAYSSQASQLQSSSATTTAPHLTLTGPLPTSVYTDTSLLLQSQPSCPDQESPVIPSTPRTSYIPLPSSVYADASLHLQLQASCPDQESPMMPPAPGTSYIPLPPHTPSPNPSPSASILTSHSSSHTLVFHPLLCYSQHSRPALVWDVRTDPTDAWLSPVSTNSGTMSTHGPALDLAHELRQSATDPPLPILHLLCGIAPHTSTWGTITINMSHLQTGVTVFDVLNAVRECMRTRITYPEWYALCEIQQNRIEKTFISRWRMSETPWATREEGVLRQDCLLLHTLWGGLTPSFVEEDVAVLTLRPRVPNDG